MIPSSCLRDPQNPRRTQTNHEQRSISWSSSISPDDVTRHNLLPSNGNFYESSLAKPSGKKYEPFHPEELRLQSARAIIQANRLRKEVLKD